MRRDALLDLGERGAQAVPHKAGEAVEVHPIALRTRIRGLQSHGEAVDVAHPGTRTAVNLQGVEVAQLSRGEVISRAT